MQTLAARIFPKCFTIFCLTFGLLYSMYALDMSPTDRNIILGMIVWVMFVTGGTSMILGSFLLVKKMLENRDEVKGYTQKFFALSMKVLSVLFKMLVFLFYILSLFFVFFGANNRRYQNQNLQRELADIDESLNASRKHGEFADSPYYTNSDGHEVVNEHYSGK